MVPTEFPMSSLKNDAERVVVEALVDRLTDGSVRFNIKAGRVVEQDHRVDARVLGFAGKTSSMHFVSRFEEELVETVGDVSHASHTTRK